MNWIDVVKAAFSTKKHVTNHNQGQTFQEISGDFGSFRYHENGFTIRFEDFSKTLCWEHITQLNVYKADKLTIDRIEMEIVYGDNFFIISEDLPGWYQFVLKTKEVFPTIPEDWDQEIIQPPFATNYRTIYNRGQGS